MTHSYPTSPSSDPATSIERKVDVVIPLGLKAAGQSAKRGQPLAKAKPGTKIAQPLGQLVTMTVSAVDGGEGQGEAAERGGSLLGKLGNFKAMVAKKPAKAAA